MKNLKSSLVILLLAVGTSFAFGQSSTEGNGYKRYPHFFVGIQGGAQTTLTDYSQMKLITPTASVYFGRWFTPVFGARLHVNGMWNKGGFEGLNQGTPLDFTYDYKYVTTDVDLLLNLCTLFGKKKYYPFNVYLIGGIGLNCAWGNDDAYAQKAALPLAWEDSRLSHNARVGAMLDINLAKHWSLNLEVDANSLSDRYNSKASNKDNWSLTAQVGIAYKFGFKKKEQVSGDGIAPTADARELTLYEQMQNTVTSRMNTWMKRLDGESKADYLARTTPEAIEAQRLEFTKLVSNEMANDRANSTAQNLMYNTASKKLAVQFSDMPSIALNIPEEDIKDIKDVNDLKFTNTVYKLNSDDKFEVLYTEVLNPATGKKYTYVGTNEAQFVQSEGFLPLSTVQEDMIKTERLQAVAKEAVQEAKDKNILSGNTTINVKTETIPASNGKKDYKVSYTYDVKDNFSITDDFAPGKYEAEKSAASTVLLNVINKTLNEDFAQYAKPGNTVDINFKGSADAKPINGKIAYNNQYGNIKNQKVKVNGKSQNMTVTQATGITTNEQLSLVRAVSVKNYITKNVKALKDMKVNDTYEVEVSSDEGSKFRRVAVDFIFHDAF